MPAWIIDLIIIKWSCIRLGAMRQLRSFHIAVHRWWAQSKLKWIFFIEIICIYLCVSFGSLLLLLHVGWPRYALIWCVCVCVCSSSIFNALWNSTLFLSSSSTIHLSFVLGCVARPKNTSNSLVVALLPYAGSPFWWNCFTAFVINH